MTAKEYSRRYDLAISFKIVSEKAFNAGLKVGRNESQTDKFKKLEKEVKELRLENKDLHEIFNDGDRLADYIAGV